MPTKKIKRYAWPCLEGLFWLAWWRFLIVWVPFPKWRSKWGIEQAETLKTPLTDTEQDHVALVQSVIAFVSRCVPWKSLCLDKALAAQSMLNKRGLDTTLYVGMIRAEKTPEGQNKPPGSFAAHAWLRCGPRWAVGLHRHVTYGVVGTYAKEAVRPSRHQEWALLLDWIRAAVTGNPPMPLTASQCAALSPQRFQTLMTRHRLHLLLTDTVIAQLGAGHPIAQQAKQVRDRNVYATLALKALTHTVSDTFKARQIPVVFLKGTPLNTLLYGEVFRRFSRDIDLLVAQDHFWEAHDALLSLGYQPQSDIYRRMAAQKLPPTVDFSYVHPDHHHVIELHSQVHEVNPIPLIPFTQVEEIPIPQPEAYFLYLCFHGAKHCWQRIAWLVDIAQFVQKVPLDWEKIDALMRERNLARSVLEAQYMLEKFLKIKPILPQKLSRRVGVWDALWIRFRVRHINRIWRRYSTHPDEDHNTHAYTYFFYHQLLLKTWAQKWEYLQKMLMKSERAVTLRLANPRWGFWRVASVSLLQKWT